jgi:hypothetical protein
MELPDDVISVIRDFSRPCTRHDWRHLHRMPSLQFHIDFALKFNQTFNLALFAFLRNQSSDYVYTMHGEIIQHFVTPDNRCYYL